ncbi:hypothetical protein KC352_g41374, partial [Hortaea werneckii]
LDPAVKSLDPPQPQRFEYQHRQPVMETLQSKNPIPYIQAQIASDRKELQKIATGLKGPTSTKPLKDNPRPAPHIRKQSTTAKSQRSSNYSSVSSNTAWQDISHANLMPVDTDHIDERGLDDLLRDYRRTKTAKEKEGMGMNKKTTTANSANSKNTALNVGFMHRMPSGRPSTVVRH